MTICSSTISYTIMIAEATITVLIRVTQQSFHDYHQRWLHATRKVEEIGIDLGKEALLGPLATQ